MFSLVRSLVSRKIVVIGLALGTAVALNGCWAFSGRQQFSFSTREFAPGEKKEVDVSLINRSFEAIDSFRLEFDAPPDVIITPATIQFENGKPDTATVVVQVKANAAPGPRVIKLRTTPQARLDESLRITVSDPADSLAHEAKLAGADGNGRAIREP